MDIWLLITMKSSCFWLYDFLIPLLVCPTCPHSVIILVSCSGSTRTRGIYISIYIHFLISYFFLYFYIYLGLEQNWRVLPKVEREDRYGQWGYGTWALSLQSPLPNACNQTASLKCFWWPQFSSCIWWIYKQFNCAWYVLISNLVDIGFLYHSI